VHGSHELVGLLVQRTCPVPNRTMCCHRCRCVNLTYVAKELVINLDLHGLQRKPQLLVMIDCGGGCQFLDAQLEQ
jgi:hypothetical protein